MDKEKESTPGMILIVKTVGAYIWGFIVLYGLYVIICGSTLPGGAFADGIIIAFSFVLIVFSHGRYIGRHKLGNRQISILTCIGVLIFLSAALAGLFIADIFFTNLTNPVRSPHPGLIGSHMFIYEIGISLIVYMSLVLIFSTLAGWRIDRRKQQIIPTHHQILYPCCLYSTSIIISDAACLESVENQQS